jgi:uncharacterized protein (DUF58 family)
MNATADAAARNAIRRRIRRVWLLGLGVAVVGAVFQIPALVPIGLLVALLGLVREAWLRRGLRGLELRRDLSTERAVWGDQVAIRVSAWNRSWLPIGWATTSDRLSEPVTLLQPTAVRTDVAGQASLRNGFTLLPFERLTRHFQLVADRRGRVAFGPIEVTTADLFAGTAATGRLTAHAELTIAPRSLPLRLGEPRARWQPLHRAAAGFPEDPALFAGVRPYLAGDSPRRIHWKATARTGSPRSKRFDSTHDRELLLALDIQTDPGLASSGRYEPDLAEALCVTTASLARDAIASGSRTGLCVAAYSYRPRLQVRISPAAGPRQLLTLMDALARISPFASGPFEVLLGALPRWLSSQADIVVVTARDPAPYLPILVRLRSIGYAIDLVAIGPDAAASVVRARASGLRALVGDLAPDWRTADALRLAR